MESPPQTTPADAAGRDYWTLAVILALTAAGFAFWRAWVCDDAFITFRYVSNCLAGHGPVFNVAERVQPPCRPTQIKDCAWRRSRGSKGRSVRPAALSA